MKRDEFKRFADVVENAGSTDYIWWAGYLWLALNKNQIKMIGSVLDRNGCIKTVIDCRGRLAHELPSGMTIAISD